MAFIKYECDTCSQQAEYEENEKGLNFWSRCNITNGCKGELFFVERNRTRTLGSRFLETDLIGWQQSNLLYTHTQSVKSLTWRIEHGLNADPSISVFSAPENAVDPTVDLVPVIPTRIEYVDSNTKIVHLRTEDGPQIGLAQAVVRSSGDKFTSSTVSETSTSRERLPYSLTTNVVLGYRIGSIQNSAPPSITVSFEFVNLNDESTYDVELEMFKTDMSTQSHPWVDYSTVDTSFPQDGYYQLYYFDIPLEYRSPEFSFRIKTVNGDELQTMDTILLLSDEPFEQGDEIVDKVFDMSNISSQNIQTVLRLTPSFIEIPTDMINSIYPNIERVDF